MAAVYSGDDTVVSIDNGKPVRRLTLDNGMVLDMPFARLRQGSVLHTELYRGHGNMPPGNWIVFMEGTVIGGAADRTSTIVSFGGLMLQLGENLSLPVGTEVAYYVEIVK